MIHGDIRLNDVVFGRWTADRARKIPAASGHHLYQYTCTYEMRGQDGYMRVADFTLMHDPFHGPGVLAAAVIIEGERQAKNQEVLEGIGGAE